MDDALGRDGWLISRTATAGAAPLQACILDDEPLRPFRNALEGWLEDHGVDAVLVRPDRYIFGAGDPDRLLAAWRRSMAPPRGDPGDAATP
jgi:3-(3-hydroxy-phenyl)propionate hydroxylase